MSLDNTEFLNDSIIFISLFCRFHIICMVVYRSALIQFAALRTLKFVYICVCLLNAIKSCCLLMFVTLADCTW